MANIVNANPITIDTEGVIAIRPICIKLVRFIPNSTGDQSTFTQWNENATPDHHFTGGAATWATATLTKTGILVAGAPAVNDIVYIYETSSGNNKFRFQTKTAGDNNDAVFDALAAAHGTVTDETSVYALKIWTPTTAFTFGADGTVSKAVREINFGEPVGRELW